MSIIQVKADQSSNAYTAIGALAGAAVTAAGALYFGAPTVIASVAYPILNQAIVPAAITLAGALSAGYFVRKMTNQSMHLDDVQAKLGLHHGSHINSFQKMKKVADYEIKNGKTIAHFNDEKAAHNFDELLSRIESSLQSGRNTSLANEDFEIFVDLEARKLTDIPVTVDETCLSAKKLKTAIENEYMTRPFRKFTPKLGDSTFSPNRKDYVWSSIMACAYKQNLATHYLLQALLEEQRDGKDFQTALENGVKVEILSKNDPNLKNAIVYAAVSEEEKKENGKEILTLLQQLRNAKLIDTNQFPELIESLYDRLGNDKEVSYPVSGSSSLLSMIAKVIRAIVALPFKIIGYPFYFLYTTFFSNNPVDPIEQEAANEDVFQYAIEVSNLVQVQLDLLKAPKDNPEEKGPYPTLISLLEEKSKAILPFMQDGYVLLARKEEILQKYSEHDAQIRELREQIAEREKRIDNRPARPEGFKFAAYERKAAAYDPEVKFEEYAKVLKKFKKKDEELDKLIQKIDNRLKDGERKADAILYPPSAIRFADKPIVPAGGVDVPAPAAV